MEKINYKILDNGCWECICKSYSKGGYPTVVFNKKTCNTHRYVFIMEKNNGVDLPKDIVIRHTCDNRKCVNPNHLISGTQNDNIQDCVNRKRTNRFKVKDCDVKEIKFLYFLGI